MFTNVVFGSSVPRQRLQEEALRPSISLAFDFASTLLFVACRCLCRVEEGLRAFFPYASRICIGFCIGVSAGSVWFEAGFLHRSLPFVILEEGSLCLASNTG
ncbi:hypothetical protein GOP47_0006069 [Adiantum capillus-veneris]|uniref:Uncharacterized protein n=1 Tax=Adiantum capillus-veneris TaxID=13818 RepID=A0A9D4ZJZ2_ADICA|nr:hypothetical protein GOP47_0006069 [Adiantum capillus-veneris]